MRKLDLLSGRVKKVTGTSLDSNRYNFLNLQNAEPDAGFPAQTNSLFASTNTGTRSWLTTNSSLSGLTVSASDLKVDEDTVFVDTSGFINTTANNLHQVLTDLDANLGATTANALTAVVTDGTIDGNGTTGTPLSVGQGVRTTDDPYFAGLQVAPQDALSGITLSNPIRVTVSTSHDLTDGDLVTFRDIEGTTQLNGNDYYVDVIDTTTVDLYSDQALTTGIDGTGGGYSSYTSGGFLIGGGYRFPSLDGTSGSYLKTDGLGQLSFDRPVAYGGSQPTNPDTGDLWYDSVTAQDLLVYNGTQFISATEGGTQSAFTLRQFAGDGSTTAFDTQAPSVQKVLVFLNGILLRLTDDFTYSNGIITFNSAPLANDTIEVLLTGDADLVGLELLGIANHDLITVDGAGNVTLSGELDMGGNKIVNLGTPTITTDAATKAYVDSTAGSVTINTSGDTGTGSVQSATQVLNIAGTANEIETTAANQSVTIGLPDDVTIGQDLTVTRNLIGPNLFSVNPATISASTVNYTVTVASGTLYGGGTGNVFYLENTTEGTANTGNPVINLYRGNTYVFDVSDTSNNGHPLRFTADGGTTEYTTGVTTSGTEGQVGATVTFVVPSDAPANLQYYCTVHGTGMGNLIATRSLGGTLIISGDLQVDGSQTVINSTELVIDDKTITVAEGSADKATASGSGLLVDLGTDGSASLLYTNNDRWTFNNAPYFNTLRLLTTDDLTGSDNYAYKTVSVTDTDNIFSWSGTGSVAAPSNVGNLTFVSGGAIDIDIDTTQYAIRVEHTDTSTIADFTASNNTNQFLAALAMTFDTYGHVQTVTPTYSNVILNNDFGTLTVTDTDSGYTWAATGNVGAGQTSDTATYVSGSGLDIDVDSTNKAIRWTNTDKGSDQNTISSITVQNTTTGFTMSETGTFNATNGDSITLIPLTGMDIDIDTSLGAFTFENTDKGSSQNIIKTVTVVDSSAGFTFTETGTFTTAANADSFTFVQSTGIDLDIDTTNGAIRITNDDVGSAQNIFKTIAVTDTNSGYTWAETGNIVADTNSDTVTLVSGTGIDLDADTTNDAILIINTDVGSAQNIFKSIEVSDTDAGYTWAETGTITAGSNSSAFKLVSGTGIDLDVDTTAGAILVQHNVSGANTTITAAANTFVDEITVDAQGHVTSVATGSVNFNVSDNYAFKTVSAGGTALVADSNTDTLTITAAQVDSIDGIVITGDAATDSFTIAHADTSSVANVSSASNTFISAQTYDTYGHVLTQSTNSVDFAVANNYAFKTIAVNGQSDIVADSNIDTLSLSVSGTGMSITTTPASDTITFENTDKGSSQNIIKTVYVTDTNSGYTWAQTGNWTASSNTDSITFVSGSGIDLDIDTTNKSILVDNTDRGSVQNIFKSIDVIDTDSGYSWSATGTINASSNTDNFDVVSGTGINVDVDSTNKAIRITNTSPANDPGSAQDIVKSFIVTDTDSGYTWSETGTYSVSGNTDTLTFVSGTGIDIDVDTTNGAIRVENINAGTAFVEATYTGDGTTTVFAIGTAFTTLSVFVNGVLVDDGGDYSYNGITGDLTFSTAPSLGDLITTYKYSQALSAITLSSLGITNHDEVTVDGSGNVTITGNLTVQGTTTQSSTQTLNDPVLNLGGTTPPTADDNLDRGVLFRWHDGSAAKVGFFGFDDTDYDFTFIPDSNGTNPFDPSGAGPFTLADYGGAKFKHVIGQNIRMGYTGANEIDTSSGNLTIDSAGGTTTLDDNVSVSGTLGVTNTATFSGTVQANNGITVDGTAFIVANSTGNVTTAGTLNVAGLASLDGGIDMDGVFTVADTTGHVETTGNLTVGGNTVLNGNVDIGNAATDTVTVNADIDSHLIPSQHETYDLGASGSSWRDLYLSGTSIFLGNATITESNGKITVGAVEDTPIGSVTPNTGAFTTLSANSLDVSGATGIDGNFDINTNKFTVASATGNTAIAGTLSSAAATFTSAKVSDLTDNRIVIVGTSGELEDDANFRFDGTNFDIGAASSETFRVVVSSGAVTASGDITATGGTLGNIKVGVTGNNEIDTSSGNLTIDSAGGTTTIDDILGVNGAATFGSTVGITSDLTVDTTTLKVDATNDRVGIGTATPTVTLDVRGDVLSYQNGFYVEMNSNGTTDRAGMEWLSTGQLGIMSDALIKFQESDADAVRATFNLNNNTFRFGDATDPGTNETMQIVGATTISDDLKVDTDTLFVDATNDRVGVNTASPRAGFALDVVGGVLVTGSGGVMLNETPATTPMGIEYYDSSTNVKDGLQITSWGSTHVIIDTDNNDSDRYFSISKDAVNIDGSTELFRVEEGGNVGIGTNDPLVPLHLTTTNAETFRLETTAATNTITLSDNNSTAVNKVFVKSEGDTLTLGAGGAGRFRMLEEGDVGLNITTPTAPLHIYRNVGTGDNSVGTYDVIKVELLRNDFGANPAGPAILFKDQDTNNLTNEARIKMLTVNDTDFGDNDEAASNLVFETTNGGSASDKMIITGRGDIGIGTVNPTAKLDVEGSIRLQSVNRDYVTSTLTTTTETAVATLSSTTYRSAKFMIQITRGSEYQVTEALMIHDGTDAFVTVYGTMFTGAAALATFDADLSGGSMRLLATSATTASTVYKISLTAIDT